MSETADAKGIAAAWAVLVVAAGLLATLIWRLKWAVASDGMAGKDWTLYANALWNSGPGGALLRTEPLQWLNGSPAYLDEHFAPTLVLLAPLLRLFHSPETLLWVQALAVAAAGLALAGLARAAGAGAWGMLAAGGAWLLHPWVLASGADLPQLFHHDALIPLGAFAAAWAWMAGRRAWAWVLITLTLGLKEDLPAMGLMLAGAWAWKGRRREAGILALICAGLLAWPLLQAMQGKGSRHVLAAFQGGFHAPAPMMWSLTQWWAPVLGLFGSFLAPWWLLLGLPVLLLHLATGAVPMLWHAWPMLTVAGLGHAFGMAWLLPWCQAPGGWRGGARAGALLGLLLLAWAGVQSWPDAGTTPVDAPLWQRPSTQALIAQVPDSACVAASDRLLPLLVRRRCMLWMNQIGHADYALVDMERLENDRGGLAALAHMEHVHRLRRLGQAEGVDLYAVLPESAAH